MRYFVLFFLITVLCRTGIAQTPDFNDICKKYNKEKNITSIRINRLGCFILSCFVRNNEPENNIVQNFIRQNSAFQLLIAEGEYSQALIKDENNFIKGNQGDELLNIKDKGKVIKIFALAKTQKDIKQLFISILQEKISSHFSTSQGKFFHRYDTTTGKNFSSVKIIFPGDRLNRLTLLPPGNRISISFQLWIKS